MSQNCCCFYFVCFIMMYILTFSWTKLNQVDIFKKNKINDTFLNNKILFT